MTSITEELATLPPSWIGETLRESAARYDAVQARRGRLEDAIAAAEAELNSGPDTDDLAAGAHIAALEAALGHLSVPAVAGVDDAVEAARRELRTASASAQVLREPPHRVELRGWTRHLSQLGHRAAAMDAATIVGAPTAAELASAAEFDELVREGRQLIALEEEFSRATGWHALTFARGVHANHERRNELVSAYLARLAEAERGRVAHPAPLAAAAVA